MPLSPCISRFQRDSWKLHRSHYGSFSMPLSQAKMLILPGRRPYTRSSASWIVKSLRFSNPRTASKSCFMSRNFNNSFRMYEQQQSPLDVQVLRVQVLISYIYIYVYGRHGCVMRSAGNSSSSPFSQLLLFSIARGWLFSFCLQFTFAQGP